MVTNADEAVKCHETAFQNRTNKQHTARLQKGIKRKLATAMRGMTSSTEDSIVIYKPAEPSIYLSHVCVCSYGYDEMPPPPSLDKHLV